MTATFDAKAYFAARANERDQFVRDKAGRSYQAHLLIEDMASRRYFRLSSAGKPSLILMEALPDRSGVFTPGHKLSDFIRIDHFLAARQIHVPEILAADEEEGFVLLEDFGDQSAHAALEAGIDPSGLYAKATDILIAMRDRISPDEITLPDYYDTHIHTARRRIVDWYLPVTRGTRNHDGLLSEYLAVWDRIEKNLPPCPKGFVHGDFHVQNLMRLADGGLGVLDFQGAMWGPLAYDLVNLLEDMRYDVPAGIRTAMLERYGAEAAMRSWVRVLGTQFHCRLLGQVIRLAIVGSKPSYLRFIPRLQNYIRDGLADPVLAPLAAWFERERVDLDYNGFDDVNAMAAVIRPDAF